MAVPIRPFRSRRQLRETCTDPVVGAILSGWRYDISGISETMRGDYVEHLDGCAHCRRRQRIHRTVDLLLLCATTLSFAAFLLAALVLHRVRGIAKVGAVHLPMLHPPAVLQTHIPASVTISLQAVAIAGVVVSMLLWVLVAIATPIAGVVTDYVRDHVSPEARERLFKHAA
jgi:hypothetical protein